MDLIADIPGHPHLVRHPKIGQGEPLIQGTGVRVRILVEYWRLGTPVDTLLHYFPHLTAAQVCDALRYADEHADEMDTWIQRNRSATLCRRG
jgi:uncharacterized protein (DUF433 family)